MLPLALFGIVLLGLSLAAGSKAAPGTPPPPPGPLPTPPIDPATAAQAVTQAIQQASPVTIPESVQQTIAQALASKNVARMMAVAESLAKQYPFAAQQLRLAADALAKAAMTGKPVAPPPSISTPSAPPATTVTTMPVPAGLTPSVADQIRAEIYKAKDPAALENLASMLSAKGPLYAELVKLAMGRAAELRAMLVTATGVQQVQQVMNQATPAVTAATKRLLVKGMTGDDVKEWQKILGVTQDGNFGSGTEAATKKWQVAHGIYADGKVGPKTWEAAARLAVNAAPPLSPPSVMATPPAPSISVPPGAPSTPLTDLQVKTAATATYIKGARRGSEDKIMIKNWQTQAGVPSPDGMFGAGSAERMAELGVSDLPMVWYWPKTNAVARVKTYKSRLNELARQADAAGDTNRATLLRASAARDNGQGRQIGE